MGQYLDDYFNYNELEFHFETAQIEKNANRLQEKFSKLTKNWDDLDNSRWVVRDYLAIKMILASSVLLTSAEYSKEKNLRIVEPYLIYYSLLCCSRAVVFTSPYHEWNDGELFQMTHKKTINVVGEIVSKYGKAVGIEIKNYIDWAREYREIFSYKFPANGLTEHHLSIQKTIDFCKLLCEVAQFQSKVLENSISKNAPGPYELDQNVLSVGFRYGKDNFRFIDSEDGYRLNYITRKQKRPFSLHLTMTEGMVEDFFGAWYPEDDSNLEEVYNPDSDWRVIFPVP